MLQTDDVVTVKRAKQHSVRALIPGLREAHMVQHSSSIRQDVRGQKLTKSGYVAMGPFRGGKKHILGCTLRTTHSVVNNRSSTIFKSSLRGFQCPEAAAREGT